LPLGTLIPAVLAGRIVSSDQNTPVIAVIPQDVSGKTRVIIPEGTRIYGQATRDASGERLQVNFRTMVLPDGRQAQLSATALMPDGSAGLVGDYHGQILARQGGRAAGAFIGGVAEGFKEKQSGAGGVTLEPGSVRNGLLNGLAAAALDQARESAGEAEQAKPYVTIDAGLGFVLFLDRAL
jgi:hypothetical protein